MDGGPVATVGMLHCGGWRPCRHATCNANLATVVAGGLGRPHAAHHVYYSTLDFVMSRGLRGGAESAAEAAPVKGDAGGRRPLGGQNLHVLLISSTETCCRAGS